MEKPFGRDLESARALNREIASLLYDCMTGDQTLFQWADFVEAGWRAITPILDVWSTLPARDFPNYAAGSCGPPESDETLRLDHRQWHPVA